MDVKALIRDANNHADKAIRRSKAEVMARRFREWLKEPLVVYRLHLFTMTALLTAFVVYEVIIY